MKGETVASVRNPEKKPPYASAPLPPMTGTVVLTCDFQRTNPRYILPGHDGATAPASPHDPEKGNLPAIALDGMHVILDIGDAPGFLDTDWNASLTARIICRAGSIEVRGTNPVGVARVRAALVTRIEDAREYLAVREW